MPLNSPRFARSRYTAHQSRKRPVQLEQLEARRVMAAALLESTSLPGRDYGIDSAIAQVASLQMTAMQMPAEGEGGQAKVYYYSPSVDGYVWNSNHTKLLVDDSDIVKLTVTNHHQWKHEIYFDGSDVGLTTHDENVDAFAIRRDGSLLFSTEGRATVTGATAQHEDLLLFRPTQLGAHTSGTWQLYFDGSDVGLSSSEGLDGVSELPDGRLIISVHCTGQIPGVSGNNQPEDLLAFTPITTGSHTTGTWTRYFDGSDAHLGSGHENVDGVSVDDNGTTIHLSTSSLFWVPGLVGFSRDIFTFEASGLGSNTTGTYRTPLTLNGSHRGLLFNSIDAIHVPSQTVANQPPVIAAIGSPAIPELAPYAFQLTASDPDTPSSQLSWSLVSGPSGASINATGQFTWTPTESQGPGNFPVIVSVSDGILTAQATFTISVTEVNQSPIISPLGPQSVDEGTPLSVQVSASDADLPAQTLTYALGPGAPSGATISSSGLFQYTPTEVNGPGQLIVPVIVTDALGASTTATIAVTVREVNQAPVITTIASTTIEESTTYNVLFSASDSDLPAQLLTWSLISGPTGAALNPTTGRFAWRPTESQGPGVFPIVVAVSDGNLSTQATFTLTVTEVNQPPVIAPIASTTIEESTTYHVLFSASDPDLPAQVLTWLLVSGPTGAALNPTTGRFAWRPTELQGPGVFPIVVAVSDGSTSTQATFTLTVTEVNQPPVLAPINDQTLNNNQTLSVTAVASDPDLPAGALTFSLVTAPTSATIHPQTGQITWLANQTGTVPFTVQVTDQGGLSATQSFQVNVIGLQLRELDNFATEFVQTLTLPSAASALRIEFETPSFDSGSQRDIRDAFEIELLDISGNPIVLPYTSGTEASFNWSEGLAPLQAEGVTSSIANPGALSSVTINLSGLAAGTQFQMRLRLVNNDSDNGTFVRINSFDFIAATTARPAGATFASPVNLASEINFAALQDVTGNFTLNYGRTTLSGANDRLLVDAQLQNESAQTFRDPVLLVIKNLSSLDVNALRPDGLTPAGHPYFRMSATSSVLTAGQTSLARQIGFLNSSNERFDYEVQILAVVNSAPSNFSTSPLTSIQAGNLYNYTAQAVDPDGDTITYSIVTGPSAAVINPSTGQLTWNTASTDLGSHDITLVATDPYGLSVEQSFVIQVVESLQNRPPVFVSIPGTEAITGSGFEVATVQAGENPVGVAVANIGLDDGTLVTINRGNQTLSQIAALGNDRYELPLELTVGEPGPVDQILRSGYNIDVGLPRYTQQFEGNSIRGMDQADLNGDGLLDIVIMAQLRQDAASFFYTQVINVVFGEGDGKFSEPVNLSSITTTGNSNPRTLRLADFDQNGTIDILALNVNTSSLYLLRGAGNGAFSPVEVRPIATTLNDFKTVDLNRDGVLDLIGATSDTRSLGYMRGNGDGTFAPFVSVATSATSIYFSTFPGRNYATSDMDGDGDIDIVYTNFTAGTVNVLTNDGSLNFTSAVSLPAPRPFESSGIASLYSVFVGDFNGDARVDIAYGALGYTSNNTGSLGMFIRNSSGFTYTYQDGVDAIAHHPGNWAGNSDPVDIDGDGDLDLIVGGVTNSNFGEFASVLRNQGDGTFAANNISLPFTDNSDYEVINRENDTKGILSGDYNGDGMLDLIAFRSADSFTGSAYSTVSVVLADRPGEFASSDNLHYDFLVNAPQRFFESGDFNNDGIVDLWSPRYQSVSRTWLGNGDGTFNDPIIATPYIGNEFLSKGFTGDFDKDGNLDIFWLGNGGVQGGPSSRFLAALGNGDGTFTRTFTLPYSHSEVFSADFNGDGYIDFASRNFGTGLDVFLYDIENPGTWLLASSFAFSSLGTTAGDYRGTLTVDDFNRDGNLDLAAAYRLSDGEPQIAVLPGVGDGTFGAPISTAYGVNIPNYNSPAQFSSGDLNEDGIADLVSYDSLAVGVHLGVGDGTFGTATVIPANDPRQLDGNIFIRDFDYDGLQDILFTDSLGAAQLHFLRGRGDGTFEERISYDPAIEAGYVEFGDLDNDGRDEVILSDPFGTNFATILYAARERLTDVVTADLNGDGNDDVLATNFDNSRVKWFLGDNLGGLTKQPDLLTANGPVGLLVTDLDQDSTNEIVTVNRSDRSVSIFSADSVGFTRSDVSVGRTPIAVTAALVNADDRQDLLVLDEGLNTVWYLSGNNDLTFAAPVPILLGDRPNDLLAGDVNGDGFTDIVVSLPDSNRLMILSGDGAGNFAAPTYTALPGSPTAIGISDFNQDGRTDIAAAIGDSDEVLILYGRGQLQFAKPQAIRVGDQPASLTIDDADGDGRDDIIVANRGDNTASVIFNRFDPTSVYRYDALAIDPDNDTVSYELIDAPGGMILDATTGQIIWAPSAEQIGMQSVAIQATDGRGGAATQTFHIDVAPARENSAPLIGTLPNTRVTADEAYTYALSATDADKNPLRYRLIDGPDGATIDPITGLVTWDARQAAQRANENSQVSQHIIVPATAALQPGSVTVEGWFKFETPEGASETLLRKTNGFSGVSYQLSFQSGILRATVGATTSSSNNVFVTHDLNREVGRWYHLAMTFDDSTKQLSLLVDGQQVATTTANLTLGYDDDTEILIAGPSTKFRGEVGSVRIWNVARSQASVQQSMSLPADAADPSLILDLDLNATESQTLRDKSSYQHVAVRSGTGNIYSYRTTGLAYAQTAPFVVSVEDGRGGYDQQSFDVTYLPPLKGSISGTLFNDQNGDDVKQVGEPALAGWIVYADSNGNQYPDPDEMTATSGANGQYTFSRLLPGNYPLRVQPRAGYETPAQSNVTVVANRNSVVDLAIDELALGQIRGQVTTTNTGMAARWKVFADLDDNGVLDPAEPFALTDGLGQFAIAGLNAGDYRVRAEMLPGWQVTNPSTQFLEVTLATNAIDVGNDFVITPGTTTASRGLQFVTTPNLSGSTDIVFAGVTYRYDALAIGLLGQNVNYDLSLAPEGMSIDATTGLVIWRPSLTQLGENRVILRAIDALNGVALQEFTLNVTAPNTAPIITSTAPSVGYVGLEVRYSIQAQDAENDTLTYGLVSGPTNATVNSLSGELTWTPSPTESGLNSFVVSVADTSGNVTLQPFSVTVSSATPTTTPFSMSPIRTQAAINQAYRSQVIVRDAIGRVRPVSLVSGPVGLTIDSQGNVAWTPATSQLGIQTLVVTADDGLGNSQQFAIDLNVTGRLINTAPRITSDPAVFAVANQPYIYDVVAVDAENDQLAYLLLESPVGMSINNVTGTLRWLPNRELVGEHAISIQVTDAAGAITLQSYRLRVRTAGGPPQITSVSPTEASVGTAWLYTVNATDVERDPLTYTLLAGPNGVVINSVTGELSWTPGADQLGLNTIAIQVSDGSGGSTSQSFAIRVSAGVPNLPPTISTEPNRFGAVGSAYSYLPNATDPEGQSIVYSLRRGPTTMTVNSSTGRLDWTPTASDVGKVVVTLVATDAGGAAAVQSFELDVLAANRTPTINSSPILSIAAGATWRYSVIGRDADLDPLRYEILEAPVGATITAFGEVQWQTSVADIGSRTFRFRVSDPRGGAVEQSFTLDVVADNVAPRVTVLPDKVNPLPWNGPIHVYVSAVDNVGIASVTMTVNGIDVPLDANNHAVLYVEDWGYAVLNIVATATDTAGNVGQGQGVTYYNDPEVEEDVNAPIAVISSPSESASVNGFVAIEGTAAGTSFSNYRLLYRRADQPESSFVEFVTSTTAITNGLLGNWDTTLLNNDEYIIRLEVSNQSGRTNILDRQVGLSGDLKLGNFRLSFTDIVIPVAGIPIQITRTYDSLRSDRDNGVGYGWQLDYRDADLRVGVPASGLEEIGIYSPMRPGVKVYLTLPGQERLSWTFDPSIRVLPGLGDNLVLASPRFTPDAGNRTTLSAGNGQLFVNEFNELYASGGIPWNPASPDFGGGYRATTQDGLTYFINGLTGKIDSITDANGNRLLLSDAGVSGSGVSIDFERNPAGRITAVVDPNGDRVEYEYNQVGDLILVRDRNGNEATYKYDSPQAHFLTEVIDALGNSGIRGEYDDFGRIISLTDANGNPLSITTNIDSSTQIIVDALGNQTLVRMDNQGNINYQRDAKGNETFRTFDSGNNLVSETNALGETTRYTYDNFDNVLTETHPDGSVTRYTYSNVRRRLVASVTSASGHTTTNTYDNAGNLLATRGDVVNVTAYTYDSRGNVITVSESGVFIQSNVYDTKGNVTRSEDAAGNVELYAYDAVGNEISSSRIKVSSSGTETFTSTFRYDKNGNLVEEIDALGGVTRYEYDANGQQIAVIDALGRRTEFVYDTGGLLVSTIFPDATPSALDNPRELKEYDAGGRLIAEIDREGRRTEFNYDAVGNLVEIVFPDETPDTNTDNPRTSQEFDRLNRSIAYTDERGNRTTFEYDSVGNLVAVTDALGNATRYEYDIDGQLMILRNPLGQEERYEYDDLGRVVRKISADGTSTTSEYDARGMRTGAVDQLGHRTNYVYDDLRLLTSVIDASGAITSYEYDSFGQVIVQRDANGNETQYEYDALGRQTRTVRPLGQAASVAYDAVGNVASQTDYDGQTIEFSYDESNRLVLKELPGGVAVSYVYDIAGKLLSIEDARGTTTYTYDARDRLVEQINPDGTFLRYGYDLKGNRISLETPSGETTYGFDALDRLRSVRDRSGDQTVYSYDAVGQLVLTERANGTQEVRAYDAVGNLVSMTNLAGLSAFATLQYTYNAKGFPVRAVDANGRIVEYAYDRNDRLVSESIFDPLSGSKLVTYSYDLVGNRLARNDSVDGVTNYTYDANDRLLSESSAGSVTAYTYDDGGNTLTKSINGILAASYGWDSEGRLIAVDSDGNGTTDLTYEYDDFGNQVGRSQDGNTQKFLVDASLQFAQIVEEYTAGGIDAYYVYGLERISQERGAEKHYYVVDRLGSTVALTNSAGLVTDTYLYDAFGQTIGVTGDSINAFRFTGEFRDVATGLDYLRARHLNTSTGRFMTTDPYQGNSQQPVTLHRYIYANASPTRFVDPTGRVSSLLQTLQTIAVAVTIPFAVGFGVSISTTIITKGKINWGDVERATRAGILTAAAANGVGLPVIAIASGLNELELIHWGRAVTGNDVLTQILLQIATFGIALGADAAGKQLTQQTGGLISSNALLLADAMDKMIGEFTGQQSNFKALLEALSQGNKSLETVVWAKHKTSAGRLHKGEFS